MSKIKSKLVASFVQGFFYTIIFFFFLKGITTEIEETTTFWPTWGIVIILSVVCSLAIYVNGGKLFK